MSVLKGEGKVPILFGSTSIAVGTLTHRGYLARPGLAGEWPTIIVVPSEWGVTSAMKDVCRRLARHETALYGFRSTVDHSFCWSPMCLLFHPPESAWATNISSPSAMVSDSLPRSRISSRLTKIATCFRRATKQPTLAG